MITDEPTKRAVRSTSTASIQEREVIDVLRAVDAGELVATPSGPIQDGIVEYAISNGWTVFVFFQHNKWEYVDSIVAADGREIDIDDIHGVPKSRRKPMPYVHGFKPTTTMWKARWGVMDITSPGGLS